MTGLAARSNFTYVSSINQNCTYRYTMPGVTNRLLYTQFAGYSTTRDITLDPSGNVWVASGWSAMPLRLYNSANTMLDYITSDLVPAAKGVTMDPEGFLWVSDPENDLIYKIDLQVGVEETPGASSLSIRPGSNPFAGSVTVFVEGAAEATLEIYDLQGRLVASGSAPGHWTWDGTIPSGAAAPSGAYLAVARAPDGSTATLHLIRL